MSRSPRTRTEVPLGSAVAHLLRSFDDESALRDNVLVRAAAERMAELGGDPDDALALVRGAVANALDALPHEPDAVKRALRAVAAADARGVPHARVMHDLAVSRAEFYRCLAAGRRFVLARVQAALDEASPPAASAGPSVLDIRLAGAAVLAAAGRAADAVAYLAPAVAASEGLDAVRAACALAEYAFDAGMPDEALGFVRAARTRAGELGDGDAVLASANVAAVEAVDAFKFGPRSATDAAVHAMRLRSYRGPHVALARALESALLTVAAGFAGYRGDFSAGARLLERSPAHDPACTVPPAVRADHLMMWIGLRTMEHGSAAELVEPCERLYRFAARHGLQRVVTGALALRASVAFIEQDFALAWTFAQEAVASSRAFFTAADHADICCLAASVALELELVAPAGALAREALSTATPGSFRALLAAICASDAARLAGDPRVAVADTRRIAPVLESGAYPLLLGYAFRVEAVAYDALGDAARARHAISESVDALSDHAQTPGFAKSARVAARLVPSRRLSRLARDAAMGSRAGRSIRPANPG